MKQQKLKKIIRNRWNRAMLSRKRSPFWFVVSR
jgi:hypothetical protein